MGNPKKGIDATRAERKAKKRKLEDAIPDLPGDNGNEIAEENLTDSKAGKKNKRRKRNDDVQENEGEGVCVNTEDRKKAKKDKKDKRLEAEEREAREKKVSKKEKKIQIGSAEEEEETAKDEDEDDALEEDEPRTSKKQRKAERKAKETAEEVAAPVSAEDSDIETNGNDDTATAEETKARKNNRNREKKRKKKAEIAERAQGKDPRFIVFIGNLPFSATKESVIKHFAAVKPKSVRHLTQKDNPTKSKGIAFVEFDGYDHMKTCLKMFHHSNFDDGISPARKINVELTVGGGGNTKDRRDKIKEKNIKLNDQRFRRIQEEEKAKWEKKKEAGGVDESAIHPSRRARVPGA